MAGNFLPSRDGALVIWAQNASTLITGAPLTFGLTVPIATTFAGYVADYGSKYSVSQNPDTRTSTTIIQKNDARSLMKDYARYWARIVQATASVTNDQKNSLGITVRDATPSPINPPTTAPVLEIVQAIGRIVKIKLRGQDSERRGKPAGCAGAAVFAFAGATPPAEIAEWTYQGTATRTNFDVEFPTSTPAGAQVWLAACWVNPRNQQGPICQGVSAFIAGGVAASA